MQHALLIRDPMLIVSKLTCVICKTVEWKQGNGIINKRQLLTCQCQCSGKVIMQKVCPFVWSTSKSTKDGMARIQEVTQAVFTKARTVAAGGAEERREFENSNIITLLTSLNKLYILFTFEQRQPTI